MIMNTGDGGGVGGGLKILLDVTQEIDRGETHPYTLESPATILLVSAEEHSYTPIPSQTYSVLVRGESWNMPGLDFNISFSQDGNSIEADRNYGGDNIAYRIIALA